VYRALFFHGPESAKDRSVVHRNEHTSAWQTLCRLSASNLIRCAFSPDAVTMATDAAGGREGTYRAGIVDSGGAAKTRPCFQCSVSKAKQSQTAHTKRPSSDSLTLPLSQQ